MDSGVQDPVAQQEELDFENEYASFRRGMAENSQHVEPSIERLSLHEQHITNQLVAQAMESAQRELIEEHGSSASKTHVPCPPATKHVIDKPTAYARATVLCESDDMQKSSSAAALGGTKHIERAMLEQSGKKAAQVRARQELENLKGSPETLLDDLVKEAITAVVIEAKISAGAAAAEIRVHQNEDSAPAFQEQFVEKVGQQEKKLKSELKSEQSKKSSKEQSQTSTVIVTTSPTRNEKPTKAGKEKEKSGAIVLFKPATMTVPGTIHPDGLGEQLRICYTLSERKSTRQAKKEHTEKLPEAQNLVARLSKERCARDEARRARQLAEQQAACEQKARLEIARKEAEQRKLELMEEFKREKEDQVRKAHLARQEALRASLTPNKRRKRFLLHEKLANMFSAKQHRIQVQREKALQEIHTKHTQPSLNEIQVHMENLCDKPVDMVIEDRQYRKHAAMEYKARLAAKEDNRQKALEKVKRRIDYAAHSIPKPRSFSWSKPLPCEVVHIPQRYEKKQAKTSSLKPSAPTKPNSVLRIRNSDSQIAAAPSRAAKLIEYDDAHELEESRKAALRLEKKLDVLRKTRQAAS